MRGHRGDYEKLHRVTAPPLHATPSFGKKKQQRSAELAIIISYPTNVSGIIVLIKTIKKS